MFIASLFNESFVNNARLTQIQNFNFDIYNEPNKLFVFDFQIPFFDEPPSLPYSLVVLCSVLPTINQSMNHLRNSHHVQTINVDTHHVLVWIPYVPEMIMISAIGKIAKNVTQKKFMFVTRCNILLLNKHTTQLLFIILKIYTENTYILLPVFYFCYKIYGLY